MNVRECFRCLFLSSLSQHAKMLRNQRLPSLLFVALLLGASILALNLLLIWKEESVHSTLTPCVKDKIEEIRAEISRFVYMLTSMAEKHKLKAGLWLHCVPESIALHGYVQHCWYLFWPFDSLRRKRFGVVSGQRKTLGSFGRVKNSFNFFALAPFPRGQNIEKSLCSVYIF